MNTPMNGGIRFGIMEYKKRILITGGAGFIGSHLVKYLVKKYSNYLIINFDRLTYAGNLENLKDIENEPNYVFVHGDITSKGGILVRHEDEPHYRLNGNIMGVAGVFGKYQITDVIHLAAESHVDRSVSGPNIFFQTNIMGTQNLLEVAREAWKDGYSKHRFHLVSTDEVYGSLDLDTNERFTEETPYAPHSPYSASKASADMIARAYHDTYGMNITISNCSNNYGPNQFPEKLIPLVINNLKNRKEIPVYGEGLNVRDWLYVTDHCEAIDNIFHNGRSGETYLVGGDGEKTNIKVIDSIITTYAYLTETPSPGNNVELLRAMLPYKKLIKHIADPRGGAHDKRYAIDHTKITAELGWKPTVSFDEGIRETVKWYLENNEWLEHCTSGEYQHYYEQFYNHES